MPEYTYEDIIINPEDPRIEIGKEYYRADYPKRVLYLANNDEKYIGTLEEIDREDLETPFVIKTGGTYSLWACLIRKKESKYVPFDLSKEKDRAKLRGAWLKLKEHSNEVMVKAIYPFLNKVSIDNEEVFLDFLLENYEFLDGTPCGKLEVVEE